MVAYLLAFDLRGGFSQIPRLWARAKRAADSERF